MTLSVLSCKKEGNKVDTPVIEQKVSKENSKELKIKSVTRKDYLAEYKYGEFMKFLKE